MRHFEINHAQSGKRIDKILKDAFPQLPVSAMYKAFRKKDIKINGSRVKETHVVLAGDRVEVYIIDSILDGETISGELKMEDLQLLDIVYEDENLIIINKKQGVSVHDDEGEKGGDTLISQVRKYLMEQGEYKVKNEGFLPSLCHRLDRNTGGLVIIAKNKKAHEILLDKIKQREIHKYYLCYVKGHLQKQKDTMEAYLYKDDKKSRVFISDKPGRGKLSIVTAYKVLKYIQGETEDQDLSLVEVDLITGRTHQIRAHFAYLGHPVLGDGKYGLNILNRKFGVKHQVLWAYKIKFHFKSDDHKDSNILSYLNRRIFEVKPYFKLFMKGSKD